MRSHTQSYVQSLVHTGELWHFCASAHNNSKTDTRYFNPLIITHKVLQELKIQSSKSELRVMATLSVMCWKMWRLMRHSDEPQPSREHKNILYTSSSIFKKKTLESNSLHKIKKKTFFHPPKHTAVVFFWLCNIFGTQCMPTSSVISTV